MAPKGGGKYRKGNGVKRVHHRIEGLDPILAVIVTWPEVSQVTPTHTMHIRGTNQQLRLQIKREVLTGLVCVAKRGTSQQIIYITTSEPAAVKKRLQGLPEYR